MEDSEARSNALAAVAEQCVGDGVDSLRVKLLTAIRSVDATHLRAVGLASVAAGLGDEERAKLLGEAKADALGIDCDKDHCLALFPSVLNSADGIGIRASLVQTEVDKSNLALVRALVAIAIRSEPEEGVRLLRRAMEAVRSIDTGNVRLDALNALVPYLDADSPLLEQALAAARELYDLVGDQRTRALAVVAIRFGNKRRRELLEEAMKLAFSVSPEFWSSQSFSALIAVTDALAGETDLQEAVLDKALQLDYEGNRASVLAALSRQIGGNGRLRAEILTNARDISNERIVHEIT